MRACVHALKPGGLFVFTVNHQLIRLGCQVAEVAEPGLAPEAAAHGPKGIDAYVHLPNFLIVIVAPRRTPDRPLVPAAERTDSLRYRIDEALHRLEPSATGKFRAIG